MGSKWKELTIEELKAPVKSAIAMGPFGSRIKAENFVDSGVPILKGGNLHKAFITEDKFDYLTAEKAEELKTSQAMRKDLVITHRGTIGQVSIIPDNSKHEKYMVSQSQLKVTLNQDLVNPYYVNYFFRSRLGQHRLLANASQVGVPAIAKASTSVKSILVPCPTLKEQNKIVSILSSLDNKIELNQQTNQTLEKMAQTLFKSWFVDFDPVFDNALAKADFKLDILPSEWPEALLQRAKLRLQVLQQNPTLQAQLTQNLSVTSNQQSRAQTSQTKNTHQHQHFPSAFELTDEPSIGINGWIPKGWNSVTFESLINLTGGGTPKTSVDEYWNGDIPWFSVVDAPNDSDVFVIDTDKHVTQLGVDKSSTKILRSGTTIISARGTVGKCAFVGTPMAMNQSCYGINGIDEISDQYVYYLTRYQVSDLQKRGHGSVFNTITRETFKSIMLPFSGSKLTNEFETVVSPWFDKILMNNKQNIELTKLRDTLLPKLISGELQIPDLETING